ncbi:hypothetical protein SmJEL517_g00623 [Synchytrium microbalum]|uniref:Mis12 domain-containing protein n=1 Tax=Synchytrium microbalum TaxID=1806994 RepID=A0A507CIZ5_9FUNG|nr:uncharacterized protein SmJEL517_g00623 [Synchytrium microbalum]TPX37735.1 hypothetical protein SmJEL517_g00623 [Synchytrium microbalum]
MSTGSTPEHDSTQETITEHLGFAPSQLIDDVINTVNELLYQTMTSLAQFVEEQMDPGDEVDRGMAEIETLMEHSVDKYFDKFELFVTKNVFSVPKGLSIPSPQYQGLNLNVTAADEESIDQELAAARKRLLASRMLNHRLKTETELARQQIGLLQPLRNQMLRLESIPVDCHVSPLPAYLTQLADSITSMRTAYENTTTQLSRTSLSSLISRASKRSQYLSSAIAHHMEERKHRDDDSSNNKDTGQSDDGDPTSSGGGKRHGSGVELEIPESKKRRRSSWVRTGIPVPAKNVDFQTEVMEADSVGVSKDIEAFQQLLERS